MEPKPSYATRVEVDPEPPARQEEIFEDAPEILKGQGIQPPYIHLANSATSLTRPSAYYNMARPGISI